MAGCRTSAQRSYVVSGKCHSRTVYPSRMSAWEMAKKYEIVRDRVPVPGGGFIEAFRMALIEFSCFGERRFDIAGYPHELETEALMSDWAALGLDVQTAAERVQKLQHQGQEGFDRVGKVGRAQRAGSG